MSTQIAIASHKANVYIDLSGTAPRELPARLVDAVKTTLAAKVLFGSDFPHIGVDNWLEDFAGMNMSPEVLPLVFKENALRVFGAGLR